MKTKVYTLYTAGPGSAIFYRSRDYHSGMWVVKVKAVSIKQAYWLLHNQQPLSRGVGIVGLDNSEGPDRRWRWAFERTQCDGLSHRQSP